MGNYHEWGDKDFDWNSLYKGINLISRILRFARVGVHSKEKYGTARISAYFWDGSLHGLTHPSYVFSQYPKWLWDFDIMYIQPIVSKLRFHLPVQWIQKRFYTLAYYIAMKKYSNIQEELSCCADYPDLIIGYRKVNRK